MSAFYNQQVTDSKAAGWVQLPPPPPFLNFLIFDALRIEIRICTKLHADGFLGFGSPPIVVPTGFSTGCVLRLESATSHKQFSAVSLTGKMRVGECYLSDTPETCFRFARQESKAHSFGRLAAVVRAQYRPWREAVNPASSRRAHGLAP